MSPRLTGRDFTRDNDALTSAELLQQMQFRSVHPHEGAVSACVPSATVVALGRSTSSGRRFGLAVALDGETSEHGRPMGRAVAASTFHHFADYNWDLDCGAPTFVSEPEGSEIKADPSRLAAFKDYVRNIAAWLHPGQGARDSMMTPAAASIGLTIEE